MFQSEQLCSERRGEVCGRGGIPGDRVPVSGPPPISDLADLSEHPQLGLCSFQAHLPRSLSSTCTVPWTALLLVSTPAPPSLLSLVHLLVPLPTCLLTWAPEVQILNLPLSLLERDLPNCLLLSQLQSQDAWVQISVSPCLAVWP